jgi:hypothetical protein
MTDTLLILLKIGASLVTAGTLLELVLQLEFREGLAGLRNPRFIEAPPYENLQPHCLPSEKINYDY